MKTNHQRQYVDKGHRYGGSPPGFMQEKSPFCDMTFGASWGGDNSNGHRGYAQAKRGARKYTHSRRRFHEKQVLQQMVETEDTYE